MLYLDTSFYSALANGRKEAIDILRGKHEVAVPLPIIAELRYGFIKGSQYKKNESNLQRFLAQPNVIIAIPTMQTTSIYAELQLYCVKNGKALSHNDIWIAALTKEGKGILVTYDQDFSGIKKLLTDQLLILSLT